MPKSFGVSARARKMKSAKRIAWSAMLPITVQTAAPSACFLNSWDFNFDQNLRRAQKAKRRRSVPYGNCGVVIVERHRAPRVAQQVLVKESRPNKSGDCGCPNVCFDLPTADAIAPAGQGSKAFDIDHDGPALPDSGGQIEAGQGVVFATACTAKFSGFASRRRKNVGQ